MNKQYQLNLQTNPWLEKFPSSQLSKADLTQVGEKDQSKCYLSYLQLKPFHWEAFPESPNQILFPAMYAFSSCGQHYDNKKVGAFYG